MSLREGETGPGKSIVIDSGVDLSANTELEMVFTLPDNTSITKTKTGGQVLLGIVQKVTQLLGTLQAYYWVEYNPEVGFAVAGEYCVYLKYTDTVAGDVWIGDTVKFTVESTTCT